MFDPENDEPENDEAERVATLAAGFTMFLLSRADGGDECAPGDLKVIDGLYGAMLEFSTLAGEFVRYCEATGGIPPENSVVDIISNAGDSAKVLQILHRFGGALGLILLSVRGEGIAPHEEADAIDIQVQARAAAQRTLRQAADDPIPRAFRPTPN